MVNCDAESGRWSQKSQENVVLRRCSNPTWHKVNNRNVSVPDLIFVSIKLNVFSLRQDFYFW